MEAAVFEDCYMLIKQFAKCDNPTFAGFCTEWKNLKFQHMYSGQSSLNEVMQTTSAIFHIAKRIVCGRDCRGNEIKSSMGDRHDVLCRIGGIYLLYAVYFKQPTKEYIKIQVSLQTWTGVCEFIEFLSSSEYAASDEIQYIFWYLYKSDAFRFCAADHHYGLEGLIDYDCLYDDEITSQLSIKYKLSEFDQIDKKLADCVVLEDNYNQLKRTLIEKKNNVSESLPATNIFHEVDSVFRSIKKIINEPTLFKRKSTCNDKNEVKRKAFGFGNDDTDDDQLQDKNKRNSKEQATNRSLRRISSRSIFSEKLPDHVLKDLELSSGQEDNCTEIDSDSTDSADTSDNSKTISSAYDMNDVMEEHENHL